MGNERCYDEWLLEFNKHLYKNLPNDQKVIMLTNGEPMFVAIKGKFTDKRYLGVNPDYKFGFEDVKKGFLLNEELDGLESFKQTVRKEMMNCHFKVSGDSLIDEALFGRCVITAMNEYYFEFAKDLECVELLERNKLRFYELTDGGIRIYGRPSNAEVKGLYVKKNVDNQLILTTSSNDSRALKDIYSYDFVEYLKCMSKSFYSGVNLHLDKITFDEKTDANPDITSITLEVRAVTYFSILGLNQFKIYRSMYDKYHVNDHTLLTTYKETLLAFDAMEFKLQSDLHNSLESLIDSKSSDQNLFRVQINDYLSKSQYVHNLNSSGNVITRDDYNVFIVRGNGVEGEGHYSGSVGGAIEAFHANVEFYTNSYKADLPTIVIGEEKFEFGGEFSREAVSELNIYNTNDYWRYYGISLIQYPKIKRYGDLQMPSPIVLDVLGVCTIASSYEEMYKLQSNAIENYENAEVHGYKLELYKHARDYLRALSGKILTKLQDYKDIFFIGFILTALRNSQFMKAIFTSGNLKNLSMISSAEINLLLQLIFVVLLLLTLLTSFVKKLFEKKTSKILPIIIKDDSAAKTFEFSNTVINRFGGNINNKGILFEMLTILFYYCEVRDSNK